MLRAAAVVGVDMLAAGVLEARRRHDQVTLPSSTAPDLHQIEAGVGVGSRARRSSRRPTFAAEAETEDETTAMARLFWFTVEFGLVREAGRVKVYGSGLISSHGDAANALGPKCDRRPFSLDAVLAQPFEIDHFQDVLFVVDEFDQLFEAVETLRMRRGAGRR